MKAIALCVLLSTLTGCAVNIVVAPHATVMSGSSIDHSTGQNNGDQSDSKNRPLMPEFEDN